MRVGFTAITGACGVRVELSPPPSVRGLPLLTWARGADSLAVLMGRLYYRAECLAQLPPEGPDRLERLDDPNLTDAALALATYRAMGGDGVGRLEGDFALVVWDGRARRLIASRDPMGGYPLFWAACPDGFAVGTGMGRLLDLLGRREADPEYLADFLAMYGQWGEGPGERTAYRGVSRVLPGTVVTFAPAERAVHRGPAWDWADRVIDPGTDRIGPAAEQYAAQLRRAVRERLRGPTLAHLSGGMGSTSVAFLARELTAEGTGGGTGAADGPIHTLSLVYDTLPKLSRERPFVEAALAALGGEPPVVAHRLRADDLLNYDGLADAPAHDEPYPGLWCLETARAMVSATARAGAATMLTGIGADEILDVQPYWLADLMRTGRVLRAWREACRWVRAQNTGTWSTLQTYAFEPLGWRWRRAASRCEVGSGVTLIDQTETGEAEL